MSLLSPSLLPVESLLLSVPSLLVPLLLVESLLEVSVTSPLPSVVSLLVPLLLLVSLLEVSVASPLPLSPLLVELVESESDLEVSSSSSVVVGSDGEKSAIYVYYADCLICSYAFHTLHTDMCFWQSAVCAKKLRKNYFMYHYTSS